MDKKPFKFATAFSGIHWFEHTEKDHIWKHYFANFQLNCSG